VVDYYKGNNVVFKLGFSLLYFQLTVIISRMELGMKKSFLFSTIIIVILLGYNVVLAEDFTKVGLVDLQRCLQESKEGEKVFKLLKKKKDDFQRRIDTMQRELLELKKELDKQAMMLSMDAQEDKKRIIERKDRELRYLIKDLNEEMVRAQGKEKKRIFQALEKIIKKMGSEENYDLIMEKQVGGVLYWSKSIDITDQIIKIYDQANATNQ
jgi:outer membrane protein